MRNIIISVLTLLLTVSGVRCYARKDAPKYCSLPVMVKLMPTEQELSFSDKALLESKINRLVSMDGYGGSDLSYLCLTVAVVPTGGQTIAGTRPVITKELDVYLSLINVLGGERFGSTQISVTGAGQNQNQAMHAALSKLNSEDPSVREFLKDAHRRVLQYYRSAIPSIVGRAQLLASRDEYEKALFLLSTVPDCTPGYDAVGEAVLTIWQAYLDHDCAAKIATARAKWRSNMTADVAEEVAAILATIDSRSACSDEADALLQEISDTVGRTISRNTTLQDEQREYERQLVLNEQEFQHNQIELERNRQELERQRIEAINSLAGEYGRLFLLQALENLENGQQQSVTQPDEQ